jgi:hypothetical protein
MGKHSGKKVHLQSNCACIDLDKVAMRGVLFFDDNYMFK